MLTACGRPQGGGMSGPCGRMWTEGRRRVRKPDFLWTSKMDGPLRTCMQIA